MNTFASFLCLSFIASCTAEGRFSLNSENKKVTWTLENNNGSISVPAVVPGGVYSDLYNASVIAHILLGFNDVLSRWVAYDTWTYTARFTVSKEDLAYDVAHLVFEGVDTVAFVELNDNPIGTTNNMFVRYTFDIKRYLKKGKNELKIQFASPVDAAKKRSDKHFTAPACVPDDFHGECHANQLRKMQASFSWDWGPAFPSVGLWRPAYISFYNGAIIRSVTTHIEKDGQFWDLRIRAHFESSFGKKSVTGYLSATLSVDANESIKVENDLEIQSREDGTFEADLNMTISENVVSLWWPNGYGEQPLYNLDVYFLCLSPKGNIDQASYENKLIGFRTVEVIEENASLVLGNTTASKGLTFYFKVNGYPLFMKGSNWIPAQILPEKGVQIQTVENLLNSAKDAHMGMLRVWGGGVYESDYFYKRCDELGLLIWQDFMFACSMYPADPEFLESVKTEVEHNVIRLQHHPSIAVWAGNNENEVALRGNWYKTQPLFDRYKDEYIKLYVNTIKPIVESLDPGRRYLVSSPSNGIQSEKDGYIADNPYDSHYGDTHYYNYLGDNWDQNIYPPTRFASEYGFQSMPTLAAMRTATQDKKDFSVDSDYSKHRQHSPNGYTFMENQLLMHFDLDRNDSNHFEKYVFYSQISQAMAMKAESEYYRQSQADWYTMGSLYWQLNDVWQAPSWSSIEYTGNWKMLHYFAMNFFAPVLVSPRLLLSGEIEVYLLNDRFVPIINADIIVDVYNWTSLIPIKSKTYTGNAKPLSSVKQDIEVDLWENYDETEVFLKFTLKAEGVTSCPLNFIFPKPFKHIKGYKSPNVQFTVSECPQQGSDGTEFFIDIKTDSIVLFLWFETTYSHGYFQENGLIVTQPITRIKYVTQIVINAEELRKSITIQYYVK